MKTHHLVVDEISQFCRGTRLGRGAVNLQCLHITPDITLPGHLEHVAHSPPPDLVSGPGLGTRGQAALRCQPGRGPGGQNLSKCVRLEGELQIWYGELLPLSSPR